MGRYYLKRPEYKIMCDPVVSHLDLHVFQAVIRQNYYNSEMKLTEY
jgi:hypothetical protein